MYQRLNGIDHQIMLFYENTGYNDYDLAGMTGLSPQLINYYRNGKRKPKMDNLKRLCEAMQIRISEVNLMNDNKGMYLDYMLDDGAFDPEKAHEEDAGYDLRTPFNFSIHAKSSALIDTGVHIRIPKGYVGMIKSKSGLNVKYGLRAEGVIDCGYTGSIMVKMYNDSDQDYGFNSGEKITQLVILPIITGYTLREVESFAKTERGNKGFGSTGR